MTARNWRYCGSVAVMMSELVATSAWIWPPVVAAEAALLPAPKVTLGPLLPAVLTGVGVGPLGAALPTTGLWPGVPGVWVLASAARKVTASLAASAFFRYTTWMLPLGLLLPG